jgi:hypothetical protein
MLSMARSESHGPECHSDSTDARGPERQTQHTTLHCNHKNSRVNDKM